MTDGRFSGGTHGFCVGHVAPEAVDGGPIAFVADGDRIVVDVPTRRIDLLVDAGRAGPAAGRVEAPGAPLPHRGAGQVRPAGHRRRARCRHQPLIGPPVHRSGGPEGAGPAGGGRRGPGLLGDIRILGDEDDTTGSKMRPENKTRPELWIKRHEAG